MLIRTNASRLLSLKKTIRTISVLMVIILMFFTPLLGKASAHAYSASYTTLNLTKLQTDMVFTLDELSVIELTGGDISGNGMLEQEEFDAIKGKLEQILKENLTFKTGGQAREWDELKSLEIDRQGDATKVIMRAAYPPVSASEPVSFQDQLYKNDAKTNYVDLLTINYGVENSTSALSGTNRMWTMLLSEGDYAGLQEDIGVSVQNNTPDSPATSPVGDDSENSGNLSGWVSFFKLGMNHILTGYDHLLFLFSLLLARQTFKQHALMITAFTVAHSITLTLSVLGWINVSAAFVEPAIALSICYVAIDNMVRKKVSRRWILTFIFGLIHGMGFADILVAMDIPKKQLGVDLISFNLGIEVVQVTLVLLLLPLLGLMHRWKYGKMTVIVGSAIALLLGGMWMVERTLMA